MNEFSRDGFGIKHLKRVERDGERKKLTLHVLQLEGIKWKISAQRWRWKEHSPLSPQCDRFALFVFPCEEKIHLHFRCTPVSEKSFFVPFCPKKKNKSSFRSGIWRAFFAYPRKLKSSNIHETVSLCGWQRVYLLKLLFIRIFVVSWILLNGFGDSQNLHHLNIPSL